MPVWGRQTVPLPSHPSVGLITTWDILYRCTTLSSASGQTGICSRRTMWRTLRDSPIASQTTSSSVRTALYPPRRSTVFPNNKTWINKNIQTLKKKRYGRRQRGRLKTAIGRGWRASSKLTVPKCGMGWRRSWDANCQVQPWGRGGWFDSTPAPHSSAGQSGPPSSTTLIPHPATGLPPPPLFITSWQVRQEVSKFQRNKAMGPENINPRVLKACAGQLAGVFQHLSNLSLKLNTHWI